MEFGVITLGDNRPDAITGRLRTPVEHHREAIELAQEAESQGFDSFHVGEHHGCDYITSSPAVILAAAAMKTEKIRLSTATALLPVRDPVLFAEDYATLDVLSNGRAEVIVSRGIIARSYGDLGFDYAESRSLFKENIELVLRLWREENVDWQGQHREPLKGFTAQPRPVQHPSPALWVGGGFGEESILLAAEMGLPLMLPSVIQPPTAFAPLVEKYRETFQDRGFGPPRVGALSHAHVAKDMETVVGRYAPRYCEYINWVSQDLLPWGLAPVLPPGAPVPSLPAADFDRSRTEGPLVVGGPQEVLDRLAGFKQSCGLDRYLFHVDSGALPQDALFDSLGLLASEVLPGLREA